MEPKVSVLQANVKLVQKGVLDLESEVQILTGVMICYCIFCFNVVKAPDANIGIIANFGISKNLYWRNKRRFADHNVMSSYQYFHDGSNKSVVCNEIIRPHHY